MRSFILLCLSFLLLETAQGQKTTGNPKDIAQILQNIQDFSKYYMQADYSNLAACYTFDGKIFPNKAPIIEGREAIQKRWIVPDSMKILYHKVTPVEITIQGDTAYDYGYYEGITQVGGKQYAWKGKYVIVWKKVKRVWKIYLDIWNALPDEKP